MNIPVLIGVGEASERLDAVDYSALSPVDLAARLRQPSRDVGASASIAPGSTWICGPRPIADLPKVSVEPAQTLR